MTYTNHYANDRQAREQLIRDVIGQGNRVARFRWDRGHKNGAEIHEISDTGIITIYNERTGKLITKLIAQPYQIERYYKAVGKVAPEDILKLAYEHKRLRYNEI